MKQPRKRGIKPENSKTVNQWGLRGRIPVDPLKPQYIWDNYYDVPQTIYYSEENKRKRLILGQIEKFLARGM